MCAVSPPPGVSLLQTVIWLQFKKIWYILRIYRGLMKTRLAKWGNSLAVRIHKPVAAAAKLRPGDYLELAAEGVGTVKISKRKQKLRLQDLLRGITAANLHEESDWGVPAGRELW